MSFTSNIIAMASPHGAPSTLAPRDAREASVSADAMLDSPYSSDEGSNAHGFSSCPWRTAEFYDQECQRYFDCPSHTVERRLSVDDTAGPSDQVASETAAAATESRQDRASPETSVDDPPASHSDNTTVEPRQSDETPVSDPTVPLSGISSGLAAEREGGSSTSSVPGNPVSSPSRFSSLPIRTRVPSRSIDLRSSDFGSDGWGESSDQGSRAYTASASAGDLSESSSPRMSARDQLSAVYGNDANQSGLLETLFGPPGRERERERERDQDRERAESAVVLPRWQPDAEVTYCPICRTQFSIFVRKHHCRYGCSPWDGRKLRGRWPWLANRQTESVAGSFATLAPPIESSFRTSSSSERQAPRCLCLRHCSTTAQAEATLI